jgi:hypothetical protein
MAWVLARENRDASALVYGKSSFANKADLLIKVMRKQERASA